MFTLEKQKPGWLVLIPARGDRPAVEVLFPAQPSAKAIRKAREAVAKILAQGGSDALMDAGDAFSREIVRWSILDWRGIGDETQEPVSPTHDREVPLEDSDETEVELGTISAFLAEPRLMEAADREFVIPWTKRDAEKNGYAPSPDTISVTGTEGADIANSPATSKRTAAAGTKKPVRPSAHTSSTSRKPTKARKSGK